MIWDCSRLMVESSLRQHFVCLYVLFLIHRGHSAKIQIIHINSIDLCFFIAKIAHFTMDIVRYWDCSTDNIHIIQCAQIVANYLYFEMACGHWTKIKYLKTNKQERNIMSIIWSIFENTIKTRNMVNWLYIAFDQWNIVKHSA